MAKILPVFALLLLNAINLFAQCGMTVYIFGPSSVCEGSTASFSVSVSNAQGSLQYQWKKNGINVTSDITGPPPMVYMTNNLKDGDIIRCVVSSSGCTVSSSNKAVNVTPKATFNASITPSSINFCEGEDVVFTATSTHTASGYQWKMNGSDVPGATGNSFTTTASSANQLKSVQVRVTTNDQCVTNSFKDANVQGIPFVVNPQVTPSIDINANPGTTV